MNKDEKRLKINSNLCNNEYDLEIYKGLYNCNEYVGDIWRGANYLSNLDDETCKRVIEENIKSISPKLLKSKRKEKISITYHKIISWNSGRARENIFFDGFFSISGEYRKCYTTLKKLIEHCESENLGIKSIEVISGYSRKGENFKKSLGGGKND